MITARNILGVRVTFLYRVARCKNVTHTPTLALYRHNYPLAL